MRDQVILRDRHCVFPWCGHDARTCDLDHLIPYQEDGPPGQTHPGNLAPLCRRHHRAKTHTTWTYTRNPDGSYTWTSRHGHTYEVGPHGTRPTQATGPPDDTGPPDGTGPPGETETHPSSMPRADGYTLTS
jgi:hypothetical protein